MKEQLKLAVCQMLVHDDKRKNIESAVGFIETTAHHFVDMVVLPEMFNCPYDNSKFPEYAEAAENSETLSAISEAARKHQVYVVAGSIPEKYKGKIYNSSFIFDRQGQQLGVHRKMHLFDIDIPGKITFQESEILQAGNEVTVVDTEFCKVGIGICYDLRFPELFRLMALKGARLIIVPGSFNMVTGPAHWEALIRIRAVDNQVCLAAASPARNENASYVSYANSMIVDAWGNIISRAEDQPCSIFADIRLNEIERIRRELPLLEHRRKDLYQLTEVLENVKGS